MTPERLAEIKTRVEAATPGPWEFLKNEFNTEDDNGDHIGSIRSSEWWIAAIDDLGVEEGAEANAIFIAHAREDVEELLASITRLQRTVKALQVAAIGRAIEDSLEGDRDDDS